MTTNLDVIKLAMKKLHVLPSRTEPSEGQAFDGMQLLQGLCIELIDGGALGRLNDVLATSDYTAKEWDRVRFADPTVITIPDTISTLNACSNDYGFNDYQPNWPTQDYQGSTRMPLNRAPIVTINTTDSTIVRKVYNAYLGAWVDISIMTQQGAFPFSDGLRDGFAAMLAERWTDEWDQPLGAETKRQAGVCRQTLALKPDGYPRNTASRSTYM